MAQKTLVILEDDLEGGEAAETVSFSLDGVAYEIDLSVKNAAKLRDALAAYVGSARRVGGRASRGKAKTNRTGNARTSDIREWARSTGLDVSERGRIPASIVEQYEKAH
ncbi:MAG TPA: Lsr2 family protein [Sporichthya sp.]|nr:Lsr2 family protein [Sporichthya sp.]